MILKKNLIKKIPIVRRLYPSIVKRVFKLFDISKIKYTFFGVYLIGDLNEPMDKEIYLFNEYESKQIQYLIKEIKKNNFSYFIDIGANSGVYSLIINKKFKNLKIRSFEPISKSINKFFANLRLNQNQKLKNIKIYKFGLSNKNANLLMKSQIRNNYVQTGGFGVVNKNEILNNFHTEKALFKIGDNVLKYKNKKVVLKIDTEGHEEFVVKGLKKT